MGQHSDLWGKKSVMKLSTEKTMLQDNVTVTITFKSDVKLEVIEEDRFMVCCLEDRDACSQVIKMIDIGRSAQCSGSLWTRMDGCENRRSTY